MHALVLHWSMVQQLFFKLNKLSHVAADVLAGRDRMIVMLLMKFVETFVVFISNDQFFWEEMDVSIILSVVSSVLISLFKVGNVNDS